MDELIDSVNGAVNKVVGDSVEEKIENAAEGLADKLPEGGGDAVENVINKATGTDLDLNSNEMPTEDK